MMVVKILQCSINFINWVTSWLYYKILIPAQKYIEDELSYSKYLCFKIDLKRVIICNSSNRILYILEFTSSLFFRSIFKRFFDGEIMLNMISYIKRDNWVATVLLFDISKFARNKLYSFTRKHWCFRF